MTTITKVEVKESTYQGKTKKSYIFTLADGTSGYSGNDKPWEYKEGDSVTYTKEVKKSSRGEYNLLTFTRVDASAPPQTPGKPPVSNFHATKDFNIAEFKANARLHAMRLVMDAYIADKIPWDQIKPNYLELKEYLLDGIDECNS